MRDVAAGAAEDQAATPQRRVVSVLESVPSREALRARIGSPERFRPEPRLLRKLEIRERPDGYSDIVLPSGRLHRVHPMVVEVHRALEEGTTFDEMVKRAAPLWDARKSKVVAKLLRGYLMDLADKGVVEIPLEEPPAVFAGRFERVKLLGRGGMGVVYFCRDLERGGAPVVLKRSWGWSTPIDKAEHINRREAAVLSILDHPLVPRLVSTFEEGGLLHVVREFADGSPLHANGRAVAAMTSADRLRVWRDVCASIHHVHERGLVYLDVKPENFVLSKTDGRVRLIDLGLCRALVDGRVALGGAVGSRGYASPEAVREKHATARSDIYGVGRVLFFLATATRPRSKLTGAQLRDLMLEKGVAPVEADLVAWCATEDAAERPASLADVIAALDKRAPEAASP